MLNVHQLNVFVTAAETLNFTQTAKKLHLTQSSVSQHIKSLETQLGMELFVRKGRTLEVTDAGGVLLPLAREIVEDSIRATERMEMLKSEVHGSLIIGCNTAPGKYVLPQLLAEFHNQHPLVKITCTVLPQQMAMEELSTGELQFALTNVKDRNQSGEFHLFMREPVVLVVPQDHRWAEKGMIEPNELMEECFVMREEGSGTYETVKHGLTGVGVDVERLNAFLVMGTSEAVALAVQQGLGCGFISKMIVDKICGNRVSVVDIEDLSMIQEIYFVRQTSQPATGAQVAFWNFITKLHQEWLPRPLSLN